MAELCRYVVNYTDPIKKLNFFTYLDGPENDEEYITKLLCRRCSGVKPEWVTSIKIVKHYGLEAPDHGKD